MVVASRDADAAHPALIRSLPVLHGRIPSPSPGPDPCRGLSLWSLVFVQSVAPGLVPVPVLVPRLVSLACLAE